MTMSLLKVRNIETYYGPIMAIKGVSFDVPEQAIVTILGANGAGKTTILKTISGIMDPEKGTIEFMGKRIDSLPPEKIVSMGISQVPEGREVFHDLTVKENLLMGAYLRKDKNAVRRDLDMVYDYFPILQERTSQLTGDMSGGQQQMVVIARALMARPTLMLLDEPSLGLSPLLVKEIYGIIERINKEQKTTILLIEQNAPMALSIASHGFVLELGRIVMDDTCQALLANEDVKEFYLGIKEESIRGTRRWKKKKKWR
jgi:branched-chain amino acid transport system ATP-binding protein